MGTSKIAHRRDERSKEILGARRAENDGKLERASSKPKPRPKSKLSSRLQAKFWQSK